MNGERGTIKTRPDDYCLTMWSH